MYVSMTAPDIGFTKEYQDLFSPTAFGGEPCYFQAVGIEYRFYLRPIEGTPYFDITSPYGYSGPVAMGENADWTRFLEEFGEWCRKYNIISEFARLHPWEQQRLPSRSYEREVYYVDLTQSKEQIWKGFDKGCRSACKKGKRPFGLWQRVPEDFGQLYRQTMVERGAGAGYLFTDAFFGNLNKLNVFALTNCDMTCAELFLWHGDYCHYFLSAGNPREGVGNYFLWQAMLWAKSQGCKIFNLGGGLKAGDSLESFKRSFTKTSKAFCTLRKVHNAEAYREVCKRKGVAPEAEGYFPAYRK